MVILHSFLALLAGFATMALLVVIATVLLERLTPSWVGSQGKPQPGYIFVNLGYSFLALSSLQQRGQQPVGYLLALVAISPVGVLAGGLVRLRVMGIL